jgi:hypothetical protein
MTKEEYRKALKTKEWKHKRKAILKRDMYACTKCYSKENLHVHHTYYLEGKMPWEVPNDCLITLCKSCHEKEHEGRNILSFVKKYTPKTVKQKATEKKKVKHKAPRKERREKNKKLKAKKKSQDNLSKKDRELQKKYDEVKNKGKLPESSYKPPIFIKKSKKGKK